MKIDNSSKDKPYIVYLMLNAFRSICNYALEAAIKESNLRGKPLMVVLRLPDTLETGYVRQYSFLLEGIMELKENLAVRNIKLSIFTGGWEKLVKQLSELSEAIYYDKEYLNPGKSREKILVNLCQSNIYSVENNVVVPVEVASDKEEYSAATIRKKITRLLPEYTGELMLESLLGCSVTGPEVGLETLTDFTVADIIKLKNVSAEVKEVPGVHGGEEMAIALFESFVSEKLWAYAEKRNIPGDDFQSGLSPYLHFGFISPVLIYRALHNYPGSNREAFLEELIIRRELAFNFTYYNSDYDAIKCLPDWARKSLEKHQKDLRPVVYEAMELEKALSYDGYWNAAQRELVQSGRLHGYMRMYWGKKILEWSNTPEAGFELSVYLNNKYALDGFDPNSYAGIAWCYGKHDRPWRERSIFGTIRYMNDKGLERKFDMRGYLQSW